MQDAKWSRFSARENALASCSTDSDISTPWLVHLIPRFWLLTLLPFLSSVLSLMPPSSPFSQDVIARIHAMEAAGRLTGVLDDRGKFLSIEPAELDAVARWINRRGRVTIADLVTESNKLIDLNGEETQEQLVIDDEDDSKAA